MRCGSAGGSAGISPAPLAGPGRPASWHHPQIRWYAGNSLVGISARQEPGRSHALELPFRVRPQSIVSLPDRLYRPATPTRRTTRPRLSLEQPRSQVGRAGDNAALARRRGRRDTVAAARAVNPTVRRGKRSGPARSTPGSSVASGGQAARPSTSPGGYPTEPPTRGRA